MGSKEINVNMNVIKINKNLNLNLSLIFLKIKNISRKNNRFVGFKKGAKILDK